MQAFKIIAVAGRVDDRTSKTLLDAANRPAHGNDANVYGVGIGYTLSKRTDLYLAAVRIVNAGDAQFFAMDNSNTGLYATSNTTPGTNVWSTQLGIQHMF